MTPWVLKILNHMPDYDLAHIFPSLTTLKLVLDKYLEARIDNSTIFGVQLDTGFENHVLNFLSLRKDAGNPVLALDITEYFAKHGKDRWGFLDKMEGLRVVYKDLECVCGGERAIVRWCETLDVLY